MKVLVFGGFKTEEEIERFVERAMTEGRHMGMFDIVYRVEEATLDQALDALEKQAGAMACLPETADLLARLGRPR